jgi:hypothetical protein
VEITDDDGRSGWQSLRFIGERRRHIRRQILAHAEQFTRICSEVWRDRPDGLDEAAPEADGLRVCGIARHPGGRGRGPCRRPTRQQYGLS